VSDARRLVDKLWSYCNVLRDDGVSTIDYVEQLTFLLFLKMAHEREIRPLKPERIVPSECSWQRLLDADGDELEVTYRRILERLGKEKGRARRRLPQGAEQDPRPGEAQAARRRPD
jgi:type I restriction enzyme M protein